MAFCWRADDGPTLNVGLVALRFSRGSGPVLFRNPKVLLFSRGGGGVGGSGPPVASLDLRMPKVERLICIAPFKDHDVKLHIKTQISLRT